MSMEGRKSLNDSGDLFESIILSSPSSDLHQSDDLSLSADTLQFIEEMIYEQPPTPTQPQTLFTQPQALFTQQLPFFTQPPSPQLPPQALPIQSPQPNLHQIHTQQPQLPNQQLPPNIFSPTNNQYPQLHNQAGQQIASPNHFNPNAFQPQPSRPLFANLPAPQQPQQQSINTLFTGISNGPRV